MAISIPETVELEKSTKEEINGAGEGNRTLDINLGKVAFYL